MQSFTALLPDSMLSVAGLNAHIQSVVEADPQLQQVWVMGEVSSANRYRSGLFFTLHDPDALASVHCVVWNHQLSRLTTVPNPGAQLIVLGQVRVYPRRGQYQLIVTQTIPAGAGLRAIRYQQLRDRLQVEGLFDDQQKRSLPAHPRIVAVVTSPQAAAWGDVQRTLRSRYPGLHVLFSPALVQGDQAPDSIVAAIERVVQDGRAEVLILSRGGGAVEDMVCFDDERVVRAIAACPIPIVSGIGHQRDESLSDLAADVCAHTPTAAAELAVPDLQALLTQHHERVLSLKQAIHSYLDRVDSRLQRSRSRLQQVRLDRRLRQETQVVQWLQQQLIQSVRRQLTTQQQRCYTLKQALISIDPTAVLQRGYAVVRDEQGQIVRSVQGLPAGHPLRITFVDGTIQVQVTAVEAIPPPTS
ncbi:MAG TPA: exodeoxyribonuclease VII large subunit [Candidatus Obscuribacterales bacterium]